MSRKTQLVDLTESRTESELALQLTCGAFPIGTIVDLCSNLGIRHN